MSAKTDNPETSSQHESAGRRRLVRGAVSIAPIVLTLRSGGLAAASCVPAKTVSTFVDINGQISSGVGATEGDTCYKATDVTLCPNPQSPNKLENLPLSPTNRYTVSNGKCKSGTTTLKSTNVAILSSGAATSFLA